MENTMLEEHVARRVVDGVAFDLDFSALTPRALYLQKAIAERDELYEPIMTRCLARLLQQMEQPRFMDVGGYVGYFACYAASLMPEMPVYVVESNPPYCEQIRRSCERNGLRNVSVIEAVLSDRAEPVKLVPGCFSALAENEQHKRATSATTLDQLCARAGLSPNIIKIDVHGSEGKVLFGMTSLLSSLEFLLLELHGHHRLEAYSPGISRRDILELLWSSNRSVYYLAGHRIIGEQQTRESVRSGRFAYQRLTPGNADALFFGRLEDELLLVTPHDDIRPLLGASTHDPLFTY